MNAIFGTQSLQLSLTACNLHLPTLNWLHYYNQPKAGYEMCRVDTFSAALTAASRDGAFVAHRDFCAIELCIVVHC